MSTSQAGVVLGALSPGAADIIDPLSVAEHEFHQVIADLARNSLAYKTEHDMLRALDAIEAHRKRSVRSGDHHRVQKETDIAPVEDVRLRKPPPGTAGGPPSPGLQIDYAQLAAAIFAHQQMLAQQAATPPPAAPPANPFQG